MMEENVRNNIDLLEEKLKKIDISINNRQKEQFLQYYDMMIETNKVMNLTSITDPVEVIDKHFVDSLAIHQIYDFSGNISVIDVGTGAGFPGIPLKIVFPEIQIVLLDSLNKRIRFLNEVVESLNLSGITCVHGRSEDMAQKQEYREKFDYCVSRAVANLSSLSELCLPFVKVDGKFISYKAGNSQEEINAAAPAVDKLGGKIEHISEFRLPDTDLERVFVEIKKICNTPKKYPRKAGTPVREPLR